MYVHVYSVQYIEVEVEVVLVRSTYVLCGYVVYSLQKVEIVFILFYFIIFHFIILICYLLLLLLFVVCCISCRYEMNVFIPRALLIRSITYYVVLLFFKAD